VLTTLLIGIDVRVGVALVPVHFFFGSEEDYLCAAKVCGSPLFMVRTVESSVSRIRRHGHMMRSMRVKLLLSLLHVRFTHCSVKIQWLG
jgi:hypothetical protein